MRYLYSMKKTTTHSKYHNLRNWSAYEAKQQAQYDLEVYISADTLRVWRGSANGRVGRDPVYSDCAYEAVLAITEIYRLPLRGGEAFTRSAFKLGGIDLPVPDHSSLSRARARLAHPKYWRTRPRGKLRLLIDSTGVKVVGSGEWRAMRHSEKLRREWVKLHVAVDHATGDVVAVTTTPNKGPGSGDSSQLPKLLAEAAAVSSGITEVIADGAYDHKNCYAAIETVGARATIPQRQGARRGLHPLRDANLKVAGRHGNAGWRLRADYGRRSLVESWMSRYKRRFGESASARSAAGQTYQLQLRAELLNLSTVPVEDRYICH